MKKATMIFFVGIAIILTKCVEQIPIQKNTFQEVLVVEALLTDEVKNHRVKLSKTFPVDTLINTSVKNALVQITDDLQNTYSFQEISDGLYQSTSPFQAKIGRTYVLNITTADGQSFSSSSERISGINNIDDITVSVDTKIGGTKGVSIRVISNETNNDAQYYRYEFDETYKIVAPKWSFFNLEPDVVSPPVFSVKLVQKTIDDRICFNTVSSNKIILHETSGLSQNSVNAEVQFLPENDFKIAHRYSVLVKQYVQSFEAFTYYKALEKQSSNESLFTQTQPGFLAGNISSTANPDDRAIGYFEVVSASEKRIFFNYNDFFSNNTPVFVNECVEIAPSLFHDRSPFISPLINTLRSGNFTFFKVNNNRTEDLPGRYLLVPKVCGDCRELGSLTKPSFWVD